MRYIVGIDPGNKGAIAFLDIEENTMEIHPIPIYDRVMSSGVKRKTIDAHALADIFRDKEYEIRMIYLEEVNALPSDGIVGAFSFGRGYGMLQGIIATLQIPVTLTRPAVWKKAMKAPADKDGARIRASQLMPKLSSQWAKKSEDGKAEASLLALHGLCAEGLTIKKAITLA